MHKQPYILFCESPFENGKVDPDFEQESISAIKNGFSQILFNYESLVGVGKSGDTTKRIKPSDNLVDVIYRGWMLTPSQYANLYDELLSKKLKLVNTPEEYQNCHYLPDSLDFIFDKTPKTIFEKLENEKSINRIVERANAFGNSPVIIKDYVKSEKHDWENACFVKNASDSDSLRKSIQAFIKLRGSFLNEGIVIREFLELNSLTNHSKSGMPLTEEYRLFFFNKKILGIYDYWEEGDYKSPKPNTQDFERIAYSIKSNFFSMDIARQKNGELIIIELGDGQVAGLPDSLNKNEFYAQLSNSF